MISMAIIGRVHSVLWVMGIVTEVFDMTNEMTLGVLRHRIAKEAADSPK